jgi:nitroimidazol reductase NimA-like FMN-containing flavoprotein (pyridoxamine 5'-phosphate oxidase superfamily)
MYRFSPKERAFLEAQRVGRMAQIGAKYLHVMPLCYASTQDTLYVETNGRSQKVRRLEAHPQVAFVVDEYFDDWSKLRGIRMQGHAEVLREGREYEAGKRLLLDKYPEQFKRLGWTDGTNVVLKITATRGTSWGL